SNYTRSGIKIGVEYTTASHRTVAAHQSNKFSMNAKALPSAKRWIASSGWEGEYSVVRHLLHEDEAALLFNTILSAGLDWMPIPVYAASCAQNRTTTLPLLLPLCRYSTASTTLSTPLNTVGSTAI